MSEQLWRKRSLAFMRTVKGWPPHFGSAALAYRGCEVHQGEPGVGDVAWFRGGHWGDCGIYLGNDKLLTIGQTGFPIVVGFAYYSASQEYLGFSPGSRGSWPLIGQSPCK